MDTRVARLFPGGEVVVDLGCGDGAALTALSTLYRKRVGIDISTERLRLQQARPDDWTFILSDLNRGIPVASGVVDAVHANQVIEHVGNPLFFAIEVYRVLRPGGVFVVTTPNIRYLRHVWRLVARGAGPVTSTERSRTPTDWDTGHIHFFTPSDLVWIAQQAGFRHVETTALIERSGRFRGLRKILDSAARRPLVKNFLSGNTLLVAVKEMPPCP